ncbi:MAG TPA: GNAT family N-acetyltransferase [Acidimicrobiia bacterium]|nr:GNAT family N-acetyltransferase [Acidimicrobiia bacterium]
MSVVIEQLGRDGLRRFAEIDRSEDVRIHYRMAGEELVAEEVVDPVPNFFAEGEHHSVQQLVHEWQPVIDAGGMLLGAFDEDRLAGIALLGDEVAPGVHQLALLFVSRPYRRSGVASILMDEVERLAVNRNATAIYVSSVPSDSAVGFYRSRGFELTDPLPDLWAREPDDIHMVRVLG